MTVESGAIIRVVVSYTAPAASIAQTVHMYRTEAGSSSEANLLTAIYDHFETDMLSTWDTLAPTTAEAFLIEVDEISLLGTVVRDIGEKTISVFGSSASEVNSAAVSAYMHSLTERTRSLMKKYWPFIAEALIDGGQFNAAAIAAMVLLFLDMIEEIDVTGGQRLVPGILSRVTNLFYEAVGGGYTTDVPAYQRRRKPNIGS